MNTELTVIERASKVLAYDETKAALAVLAVESARIVEVTNPAGYQEAHSARMKLKNTRVEITRRGKAAREDATAFSKAVIEKERELIAVIEPEEIRLQSLQTAWDDAIAAEAARKAAVEKARVDEIRAHIDEFQRLQLAAVGANSEAIANLITLASGPLSFDPQEFADEAKRVQAAAIERLTEAHAAAVASEEQRERERIKREAESKRIAEERAELAKLRAAQEEADRKAAAERERLAAEERAKVAEELRMQRAAEDQARAERQAAENAERKQREVKEAAERAERERADAAIREIQRREQEALDARIAEIERQKAEQERAARQAEIDSATLLTAATEAHELLTDIAPNNIVTAKLGAALVRENQEAAA